MKNILTILFIATLLAACGGDDGDMQDQGKQADTGKEMQPPVASEADGKTMDGIKIVDHSQDEKEFRLRRSLNGVERMIEQYKEEGYDTTELESRKQELEKELNALVSG